MGEVVKFPAEGCELKGYLESAGAKGKGPGVLVIHEIWGLVDHIKDVTSRLAAQGYTALSPDLYSRPELASILTPQNILETTKIVFKLPPERRRDLKALIAAMSDMSSQDKERLSRVAQLIYGEATREKFIHDVIAALNYLKGLDKVNPDKVASIGFCMGGGLSLSLACRAKLAGAVVFYGENPAPISLIENLSCPVLGIYAGDDARINAGLPALVEAMVRYGKALDLSLYPGVPHAFFNDTRDTYREVQAKDAWGKTLTFFEKHLKERP